MTKRLHKTSETKSSVGRLESDMETTLEEDPDNIQSKTKETMPSENQSNESSWWVVCPEGWKDKVIRLARTCRMFILVNKVDIIMSLVDIVVSYPLVVVRRQCQVRADCDSYHLTPFTLVPVVVTLVQKNGFRVDSKGMFSVLVLRLVQSGVERIIARLAGWPLELPPTWHINVDWLLHFLLKLLSIAMTTPVYNLSIIYTISICRDFIEDNTWGFVFSSWRTLLPTVMYRMLTYTFIQAALSLSAAFLYLNYFFNQSTREMCQTAEGGITFEDKDDIILTASVFSYLFSEAVLYPLETVVYRLILQGTDTVTNDMDCGFAVVQIVSDYNGFFDCFENIVWLEGRLGLYKGFGGLIVQSVLFYCSVKLVSFAWQNMMVYTKRFFTLPPENGGLEDS